MYMYMYTTETKYLNTVLRNYSTQSTGHPPLPITLVLLSHLLTFPVPPAPQVPL